MLNDSRDLDIKFQKNINGLKKYFTSGFGYDTTVNNNRKIIEFCSEYPLFDKIIMEYSSKKDEDNFEKVNFSKFLFSLKNAPFTVGFRPEISNYDEPYLFIRFKEKDFHHSELSKFLTPENNQKVLKILHELVNCLERENKEIKGIENKQTIEDEFNQAIEDFKI